MTAYKAHPGASGDLPEVHAWTDGSYYAGVGGWAVILEHGDHRKELSGGVKPTTNNRMEMQAALEALFACKKPVRMVIHTDSRYVERGWHSYLPEWQRNGWLTRDKKPIANQDLWGAMIVAARVHNFRFAHLRGHSGVELNERADQLAKTARERLLEGFGVEPVADPPARALAMQHALLGA